jgi:hypothetical protein
LTLSTILSFSFSFFISWSLSSRDPHPLLLKRGFLISAMRPGIIWPANRQAFREYFFKTIKYKIYSVKRDFSPIGILYVPSAPACSQYFFGLHFIKLAFTLHLPISGFTHSRNPTPSRISTFSSQSSQLAAEYIMRMLLLSPHFLISYVIGQQLY